MWLIVESITVPRQYSIMGIEQTRYCLRVVEGYFSLKDHGEDCRGILRNSYDYLRIFTANRLWNCCIPVVTWAFGGLTYERMGMTVIWTGEQA